MKNVQDVYPCSPLQEGMLFQSVAAPGSGVYVNRLVCRLEGPLGTDRLRRAWELALARHPALRTAFVWEGLDEPRQIVRREVELPWTELDWRGAGPEEQERRLAARARDEVERGFDLRRAPLLRVTVARIADDAAWLIWTHHHLLLDGWSLFLVLPEVIRAHDALAAGREPELPPVRPFRDYVAWLADRDLGAAERFWRERLAGFTRPTRLPIDRGAVGAGQAAVQGGRPQGEIRRRIDAGATARIVDGARRHRLTLNTLVLGAWAELLGRYSGRDDVLFGTTVSGRPAGLPGVESMVGLFINTLPVRVRRGPGRRAGSWLADLQGRLADLREVEHTPLARILGWCEVSRPEPLFETLVVVETHPAERRGDGAAGLRIAEVRTRQENGLPLTILVHPGPELRLVALFDRGRFEDAAVERLLGHLETLLDALANEPSADPARLPLLTGAEAARLAAWNDTGRDYPLGARLDERIAGRAAAVPDRVAVVESDRHLSYAGLRRRAAALAGRLAAVGVGPESRVALLMERGLEMEVALVATLEAGAAYVPLDPEHPGERLAWMLDDCRPGALLLGPGIEPPATPPATPVLRVAPGPVPPGDPPPPAPGDPGRAAYVLYTSGSTGRPKGVVVPHRAIANRLLWMQDAYRLGPADRVLQKTPSTFDVSVWELFWPLLEGATLVMARPGGHRDPEYLARAVVRHRVTTLHFVPSMLKAFLEHPAAADCAPPVRQVVASGEALTAALVERFRERLDGSLLHNLYGPTEAAVDVTAWTCPRPFDGGTVPIGAPIANLRTHVLDAQGEPVPVGVPGHLHLAGAGLARGYLGRPALTAAAFVPDPFGGAGERCYRTGDVARWLPGGELDFLGRIDHQVKVRGVRIELGEIESALLALPEVRDAVVVARELGEGDKSLVAYVVPGEAAAPERPVDPEALGRRLAERLPAALVPARFEALDEIPLSPNGKVDRSRLPQPGRIVPRAAGHRVPRTPAEEVLASIWARVLGVDEVGVDESFFTLGGDSIRSLRVVSLARERGLELDLQRIFRHPTLGEMARSASAVESDGGAGERPAPFGLLAEEDGARLAAQGDEDAYPLSRLQAGMLFHSRLDPESAVYHDVFALTLQATVSPTALRVALDLLAERHPVLRTGFDLAGYGEPVQRVRPRVRIPLAVVDLTAVPDGAHRRRALEHAVRAERARGFDPAGPTLLRYTLQILGSSTLRLILGFHHAILDGWSVAAMTTELLLAYRDLAAGREPALPPAPETRFRDFVALEGASRRDEDARAFWGERLRGAPRTVLPRLRPPGPAPAGRRRVVAHEVPLAPEVAAGVVRLARSLALPVKAVLLAAHLRVIATTAGQDEVTVGLVTTGRPERSDADRVLGLFLNTLPLRVELRDGSWRELIRHAFDAERETLAHRRYPLQDIQRDLGGDPPFEVSFNYVQFHVYQALRSLDGLAVTDVRFDEETNFPLVVNTSQISDPEPRVSISLAYDSAQLDPERVKALGDSFRRALEAMVAAPDARHRAADLVPEDDRRALARWNDQPAAYPFDRTLPELLRERAERVPDAVAVVSGGEALSYRALGLRTAALARELRRHGVGPESTVAVLAERSLDLIVGLAGVLASGGAYVPLDPDYPAERLDFMLRDSGAALLLAQEGLLDRLPERPSRVVLFGSSPRPAGTPADETRPGGTAAPDSLAYVIYTSGSTGRPKGAMVHHRAIVNRLAWMQDALRLGAGDTVLQKTPASFDVSVWELFWPLLEGATLVMLEPGRHRDPGGVADAVRRHRVTTLHFVPSMFHPFLRQPEVARCHSLLRVVTSGEALPRNAVDSFFESFPGGRAHLFNLYGPTEAAVDVTWWPCTAGDRGPVPIGEPIANTSIHVLDRRLRTVPLATPGELCIGGVAVGRGYRGRPVLTAERFVPDPTGPAGARLYRTGDLARWTPAGSVEYLGRIDHQVKIRGFRVELDEIAVHLSRAPAVAEAVVIAREEDDGARLVAYLTAAGERPAVEALRDHLAGSLPDAMIPAHFVWLDALPLTPSGKVDRGALPDPAPERPRVATEYAAPRDEPETVLAEALAAALGIDRVGIDDDFFALGGDSILSLRAIALAAERGVEVSLAELFEHRTVRALAPRAELADRVDDLSDDDVDRLLGELLGEAETASTGSAE